MRFMNTYDIDRALRMHANHPVLGPASRTLRNLENWTNRNSDGWCYWPKPVRAAKKLIELIEGEDPFDTTREDATKAAYKQALGPLKSFRTRQGADFDIEETT